MIEIKDSGDRTQFASGAVRDMHKGGWCLYKHTSPSGKVYIGITQDVKHRWRGDGRGYKGSNRFWNAIKKYGWDKIKHEILYERLTKEDASEKEKEIIAEYNSADPNYGYNLALGGFGAELTEEAKEKKRNSLKGHPVSDEVKRRLSNYRSIPIICIETGTVYANLKDAEKKTGICGTSIGKNCNGKASNAGGLHFAKLIDFQNGSIPQFATKSKGKPVRCVDTGVIYPNQSDAAREYNVSSQAISHCCTGKTSSCSGMKWEFVKE